MRRRKETPAQLAANIVEEVILTDGDNFLETMHHQYSWWQNALVDVKLFWLMCTVAVGVSTYVLISLMMFMHNAISALSHWISTVSMREHYHLDCC